MQAYIVIATVPFIKVMQEKEMEEVTGVICATWGTNVLRNDH